MENTKIEPSSPFECWCMSCSDCVYYSIDKKCNHPECYPDSPLYNESNNHE